MIIERMYDAILDRKSTAIYGDERDRLHWYETIAVAASVQWTLIPWALAVLAILDAERFGPALWVLFGCHFVPVMMSNAYVARRKVSPVRYDCEDAGDGSRSDLEGSRPMLARVA